MKTELNELFQEISNFADVIAYMDNPANSDFQNACQLFSRYLEHRFAEITVKLQSSNCKNDVEWAANEINKFSDLISLPDSSTVPYIKWTSNLFQHCEKAQLGKVATA